MYWWDGDWQLGWMAVGWVLGIALVAVLVWALLRSGNAPSETPETVLKRRYAQGEIDRDTYRRMLSELHSV